MTAAALRRLLQTRPTNWTGLSGDIEFRWREGFPKGYWEFVAGFQSDGHTVTNRAEGDARSLAEALRVVKSLESDEKS